MAAGQTPQCKSWNLFFQKLGSLDGFVAFLLSEAKTALGAQFDCVIKWHLPSYLGGIFGSNTEFVIQLALKCGYTSTHAYIEYAHQAM